MAGLSARIPQWKQKTEDTHRELGDGDFKAVTESKQRLHLYAKKGLSNSQVREQDTVACTLPSDCPFLS